MTNDELRSYIDSDDLRSTEAMHNHFTALDAWDWSDVREEGCRVYGLVFFDDGASIESESPIDDIISAVAAQAYHGAFSAMACCLGVDAHVLRLAIAPWYEDQKNPPESVGIAGLQSLIDAEKAWLDELEKSA